MVREEVEDEHEDEVPPEDDDAEVGER